MSVELWPVGNRYKKTFFNGVHLLFNKLLTFFSQLPTIEVLIIFCRGVGLCVSCWGDGFQLEKD